MKYKNIPSVLHNFVRSFCSLMNSDGQCFRYIYEYMNDFDEVRIDFNSGSVEPYILAVSKSVDDRKLFVWEKLCNSQNVDPARVNLPLMVYRHGLVSARMTDDRGKEYLVEKRMVSA